MSSLNYSSNRVNSSFVLSNIITPRIELSSSLEIYGDSISDSLDNPTPFQVWADYVCDQLNLTKVGNGIGGNKSNDMTKRIYNTRAADSNNSAAIFIGTNDFLAKMGLTTNPDIIIDQIVSCVLSGLLYCLLPTTNKFNARNATKTGTWTNTSSYFTYYTSVGSGTIVPGSTIAQQVTGRYVSWTCTFLNPGHIESYISSNYNFTVTNCVMNLAGTVGVMSNDSIGGYTGPIYGFSSMESGTVGGLLQRTFILDTGREGTHLITLSAGNPQADQFCVDWFAGWSKGVVGNPSLVVGLPVSNYARIMQSNGSTASQNDIRRLTYNRLLEEMCYTLKKIFYLPANFVNVGMLPFAGIVADGIHYSWMAQKYIGQRVVDTVQGNPL